MPESLTRKKPPLPLEGGRLQIGIPAGFMSEHPAGLNRNPHISIIA
jgi:hypothetical protein